MNWKKLKEKYPKTWNAVYDGMIEDLKLCMESIDVELFEEGREYNILNRIAHNAAFLACDAILKIKE